MEVNRLYRCSVTQSLIILSITCTLAIITRSYFETYFEFHAKLHYSVYWYAEQKKKISSYKIRNGSARII